MDGLRRARPGLDGEPAASRDSAASSMAVRVIPIHPAADTVRVGDDRRAFARTPSERRTWAGRYRYAEAHGDSAWTYVLSLDLDADRRWRGTLDIDGPDVRTRYSVWGERSGEQAMHIRFADARPGHQGPSPEPGAELFGLNELAMVEFEEPERPPRSHTGPGTRAGSPSSLGPRFGLAAPSGLSASSRSRGNDHAGRALVFASVAVPSRPVHSPSAR